jgi:hypothetical protein
MSTFLVLPYLLFFISLLSLEACIQYVSGRKVPRRGGGAKFNEKDLREAFEVLSTRFSLWSLIDFFMCDPLQYPPHPPPPAAHILHIQRLQIESNFCLKTGKFCSHYEVYNTRDFIL